MDLTSGIFMSQPIEQPDGTVVYDRANDETFLADYLKGFFTDGVFPYPADSLQVTAAVAAGMKVTVKNGKCLIDGHLGYPVDKLAFNLNVEASDQTFDRVDAVVVRLDKINRKMEIVIKKGTASTVPVAPALTRTSDVWELMLATVLVKSHCTAITDSMITDYRRTSLCGLVSPLTAVIRPEDFERQLNASFNEWFDNCKNKLTTEQHTNLLNSINELTEVVESNYNALDQKIKSNKTEIDTRMNNQLAQLDEEKRLLKQIIRVKMSGDRVYGWNNDGNRAGLPFSVAFNGGKKTTNWGYLNSEGNVVVTKSGEYFVNFYFYSSDVPSMSGPFGIRVLWDNGITIAEQYVYTKDLQCSGAAGSRVHLNVGDVVTVGVYPPANSGYRISCKQTYLVVAPVFFD